MVITRQVLAYDIPDWATAWRGREDPTLDRLAIAGLVLGGRRALPVDCKTSWAAEYFEFTRNTPS